MVLVTVRCPKTPSPGPDFSFRLSVLSPPLIHLSGGQHISRRDVWVSPEAGAGLTLGQPWEVWGWPGVSDCAGMSWEPFQSRGTDFCSRAECLGCSCLGWSGSGLLLQQMSLLLFWGCSCRVAKLPLTALYCLFPVVMMSVKPSDSKINK